MDKESRNVESNRMRLSLGRGVVMLVVAIAMVVGTTGITRQSVSAGQGDGGYIITSNTYLRVKPNSKSALHS